MVSLYDRIVSGEAKIALVGLGYVGLPIAVAFAKKASVIGYDINASKIEFYRSGYDPTKEVGDEAIRETNLEFTHDARRLQEAKFIIVAVPTPIHTNHVPDLAILEAATRIVGQNLTKGSIVVFESTVYPGVTEDICIPILERESELTLGVDFKVGYSPERINPGDKVNRLETIVKVVSGLDEESLDVIARVYELVVEAGVYKAESIKVAEAAKAIENAQRDLNIAFVNELSIIFNRLGIDTKSVLNAAGTKWNFIDFQPGLVGGHCIGIDPYYLTYAAEQAGYYPEILLAGRRINDGMGKYVAENLVKLLMREGISAKGAKVAVLGFTFKENCPDTRNTRVQDIIQELRDYGIYPMIYDPVANVDEAESVYGVSFCSKAELSELDAIIVAVGHKQFCEMKPRDFDQMFSNIPNQGKVLIDVKGLFNRSEFTALGYAYWRL